MDETGVDSYLYRTHGWSERGKPLMGSISGRRFKRVGIVADLMEKSMIAPLQYEGTMDSRLFEFWLENCLLHTFAVIPKRWVVERTFGWLEHFRRLWKNCERLIQTAFQMTVLAFVALLLRRL